MLNLASWWRKQEPLADWIAHEAGMSYQVPTRTIRRWVDEEAVIPLLDGLDEVLPEQREACVEAINRFHHSYRGVGLAVCSRVGDYDLLKRISSKSCEPQSAITCDHLTTDRWTQSLLRGRSSPRCGRRSR